MLRAYIDDSGSDWQAPYFLLAGYVASESAWQQFDLEWQAIQEEGPRPLLYLKGSEAQSLKGAFQGWQPEERDEKVRRLANVIVQQVSFGVVSAMSRLDYNKHVKGQALQHLHIRSIRNTAPHPYFFLFHDCVNLVLSEAIRLGTKVSFVLDRQQKKEGKARTSFYQNIPRFFDVIERPKLKEHIGSLCFADEGDLPLQAADLLAWHENRRRLRDRRGGGEIIRALLSSVPIKYSEIGPELMRQVVRSAVRGVDPLAGPREQGP